MVSKQGVEPIQAKVQAIQQWRIPCSMKTLRGFLGLTGFYQRFIKRYATLAAPLTGILTNEKFMWTIEVQHAFEILKDAIGIVPVLMLLNWKLPFVLEIDASGIGIDTILSQKGHPIAFFSNHFCPKLLLASTYVWELYAITTMVKKWQQYLLGHHFIILTNHHNLKELVSQVVQAPEQQLYLMGLIGYDYSIQYHSSRLNQAVDVLPCIPATHEGSCFMLSMPRFTFMNELR